MNADEQRAFERLQRTADKLTAERDEARAQTERMAFKIVEIEDGAKTIRGAYSDACTELSRLRDENARLTRELHEAKSDLAEADRLSVESDAAINKSLEVAERDRDAAIAARDEMARVLEMLWAYCRKQLGDWYMSEERRRVATVVDAALASSRDGKEGA